MTEEGAEPVHPGVDILTVPEPVDEGPGGEGVALIPNSE